MGRNHQGHTVEVEVATRSTGEGFDDEAVARTSVVDKVDVGGALRASERHSVDGGEITTHAVANANQHHGRTAISAGGDASHQGVDRHCGQGRNSVVVAVDIDTGSAVIRHIGVPAGNGGGKDCGVGNGDGGTIGAGRKDTIDDGVATDGAHAHTIVCGGGQAVDGVRAGGGDATDGPHTVGRDFVLDAPRILSAIGNPAHSDIVAATVGQGSRRSHTGTLAVTEELDVGGITVGGGRRSSRSAIGDGAAATVSIAAGIVSLIGAIVICVCVFRPPIVVS